MTDPTEAAAGYELPAETAPPAEPATGQPAQPAQSGAEFRKKYEDALRELAQLKTEKRQRTLGDAVKAAGLSEAALELYPKDAEATPEAVKAWADKLKAAVPGQQQTAASEPPATTQAQPPAVPLAPEAARVMGQVQEAAATAPATEQGLEALMGRMRDPSISYPTLLAEMRAMGFQPPP